MNEASYSLSLEGQRSVRKISVIIKKSSIYYESDESSIVP